MSVEEVFEEPHPEHLHHLTQFKEIKETIWRGLTLQEFKLPSITQKILNQVSKSITHYEALTETHSRIKIERKV